MHPESDFYQISGYNAHSQGWFRKYDDKPMINAISSTKSKLFRPGGQDSPVELILGILHSGASYLLMTSEQMVEFTHKHRLTIPRNPWRASQFLSLSPIYFNSLDELSVKIATYKQRQLNKNRRGTEKPRDNSPANRGYFQEGSDGAHYHRAYFEHQRTLYRVLTRDLEPGKVGLATPPWLGEVCLKDPLLVHVGWTDALFPSFFEQLTGSTVHLKLKVTLKNPNSKESYFSEVIEDSLTGLHSRLRDLLEHDANKSGVPLVVLVHDEDVARAVLSRAGIDVDSWPSGLSGLLPLAPVKTRHKSEGTAGPTTLPRPSIVDTQKLVEALMETSPGSTVPHSAKVLRMQTDASTCAAGDDSLLQLRMWTSMAQGLAIDEQRKQRSHHQPDCAKVLAPPPQQAAERVDPNDMDPNDVPPARRPTIADDFSDDDDW